jgi:hypothetical protein
VCLVILCGNISLLCVGLTDGIENIQRKSVHVMYSCVQVLEGYGKGLGNVEYKSVLTIFISIHTVMCYFVLLKGNKNLKLI